jgi:hypothetical protein
MEVIATVLTVGTYWIYRLLFSTVTTKDQFVTPITKPEENSSLGICLRAAGFFNLKLNSIPSQQSDVVTEIKKFAHRRKIKRFR